MKVLYATDGFDPAIDAGLVLEKLGNKEQLDITVMSVTHAGVPAPEHALMMLDPLEGRRKDSMELVDSACEKLAAAGFRAKGHVAEGHPGPEIVRVVEDEWYDLVVMGAGRRTWLGHRLLGSVSSYVLHSSPWSVMIVHSALPRSERNKVLLGVDGSRGAEMTLRMLSRFADPATTTVQVATAFRDPTPAFYAGLGTVYVPRVAPEDLAKMHKYEVDHAQRLVESAATELRDAGFVCETAVLEGHASEKLLELADDGAFDLVAVGSRGLGPFRRALLGSVSEHVARHAKAALLGRRLHE